MINKNPKKVVWKKHGASYIIRESRFYGLNTISNWMARYIYQIILKRIDYEPNIIVSEIIKPQDIPNQNIFEIDLKDIHKKNRSPGWKKLITEWEKKVDKELSSPSPKHARLLSKIDKVNDYILHLSNPDIISTWVKEIGKYAKKFNISIMDINDVTTMKDVNLLESQFFPYYIVKINKLIDKKAN